MKNKENFGNNAEKPKKPNNTDELVGNNAEKQENPNSISELISMKSGLLTSPDKVYRSVGDIKAIEDISACGLVRNRQSAGIVPKCRWGERVFWSKGAEGKHHVISTGTYVIEAPLSIAEKRVVKIEDITAIYTKNENGEIIDILK